MVSVKSGYIIIPARLESTRLHRKLLLSETGKPLIQHTYESASRSKLSAGVLVAADDESICDAVRGFGGNFTMTAKHHANGTERISQAVSESVDRKFEIIVNVQGDEPDVSGESIDLVISLLENNQNAVMSTVATPIRDERDLGDPSCVKVVFDRCGNAMYFSRSPIPRWRQWSPELLLSDPPIFYRHVGIYAYRREFLMCLPSLPSSDAERIESLEQLRVLFSGYSIKVGIVQSAGRGIDTIHDYRRFVSRWLALNSKRSSR